MRDRTASRLLWEYRSMGISISKESQGIKEKTVYLASNEHQPFRTIALRMPEG